MADIATTGTAAAAQTNEPLIRVEGLRKSFGSLEVLKGIDLSVNPGEVVTIIGASGSGKSTFLRCLNLLETPDAGHIWFHGQDLTAERCNINKLREDIGMVFQGFNLFNNMDVLDNCTLAPVTLKKMSKAEAEKVAMEHLTSVGLEKFAHAAVGRLSGGQKQRVAIARALCMNPQIMLFDEPTSALDVTVQKRILDHLHMLTDSLGTAVLFITHDLGLAAERAQHIVVMYKGQVVESGPSLEVLQHPQHPYTKRLVAAAPSLASQRIISAKERGEDADALLDHHIAGESTLEKSEHIITVDHLTKEFKLPRKKEMFKAVDDVSFSVKRGTTLAIVGESGSGKSTVANMVLHLLKPTSGKVFYEGRDTSTFKSKDLLGFRRHVQPVFQNPYGSLDPMYSIFRSIEEPLRIHKIGDKKWRANRVKELLDMVEMPASVMGRYPNELSGGQRQRIAIARAMALDPDVIVCDEAVSALDVLVQDQVLRLLNDLQAEKGLSYLFITHDLAVVRQIADEVVVMQHGKLVEHATTDEVFDHPQKQYTRDLLDAIPGGKLQLGLD